MIHGKTRIIIIEDNGIISYELRVLLEGKGYNVISIKKSGEEAVIEILREKPDLVLMDINLSRKMDGIEAAEKIHSILDTPIIYITSYCDEITFRRAQKTNPIDYVIKPFDGVDLCSRIETALYKYRNHLITPGNRMILTDYINY